MNPDQPPVVGQEVRTKVATLSALPGGIWALGAAAQE